MKTLILICSLAIPRADCNPQTAEIVIQGPKVKNSAQCGVVPQAYIAGTWIAEHLDGSTYLKVVCYATV